MSSRELLFVQALPLGKSRQELELANAKAKSHAAKVSHSSRRAQRATRAASPHKDRDAVSPRRIEMI
jgi:hypothetical protein